MTDAVGLPGVPVERKCGRWSDLRLIADGCSEGRGGTLQQGDGREGRRGRTRAEAHVTAIGQRGDSAERQHRDADANGSPEWRGALRLLTTEHRQFTFSCLSCLSWFKIPPVPSALFRVFRVLSW